MVQVIACISVSFPFSVNKCQIDPSGSLIKIRSIIVYNYVEHTSVIYILLSPATKWKGDIGLGAVRRSFRPSVPKSFPEHNSNYSIFLKQTWYIHRSGPELVPFAIYGFLILFILPFPWFPLRRGI